MISYGKNVYGKEEILAVQRKLNKTTQMGFAVNAFEKKIAQISKKKYALMVNSGTSALMLAVHTLNLPKGSEVIIPCLNFGTAISTLLHFDLKPRFVDVDIDTLQINEKQISNKINSKTKAIMVPNLIGNLPNWQTIMRIAKKNKLKIIEDSADTLGGKINKKTSSAFCDISITSFYGSHVISCAGNGGMLLTDNKKYFERAKVLRSWGRMSTLIKDSENIKKRLNIKIDGIDYDKKFVFSESGYNFEPSEIGAAFGLIQLKRFKRFSDIRNKNFFYHCNFFKKYNDIFIIPRVLKNVKTNFLAYPVILKENIKFSRKKFQIFLENNKIQTRPIFSGNSLRHPAFIKLNSKFNNKDLFPNSDYIMRNGLLIGCHQGLNLKDLDYVHNIIKKFITKSEKN